MNAEKKKHDEGPGNRDSASRWRGPDARGTRPSHVRARKTRERRAGSTLGARTHARNVVRERTAAAKGPAPQYRERPASVRLN